MYQVRIRQSWAGDELLIHSAKANALKLVSPVVTLDTAAINTFTFDIYPDNPGYTQLNYLTTLIRVFDTRKQQDVFEGRVLLVSDQVDATTPVHRSVTCEALEAVLNDSISPYLSFKGRTRSQILAALIAGHNTQVEPYKQVQLGDVNFGSDAVIADCYTDETADTYSNLSSLVMAGFELRVRNSSGLLYIDVAKSFGHQGSQVIEVRRNLLSAARAIDPSSLVTVLKPMGPAPETDDTDVDVTAPNMDISSVNGGSPYIRNQTLIDQFGVIVRAESFDSATSPTNLKALGDAYMAARSVATIQLQVSVVDLAFIRGAPDDLWYGNSYRTRVPPMGIDDYWRISQQTLYLVDPGSNTVTLGDRVVGQESYTGAMVASADAIRKYRAAVSRQNKRMTALADAVTQLQDEISKPVTYYDGAIIDVSYYQGDIDWSAADKAGLALAIVRVQDGSSFEDPKHVSYLTAINTLGINYAVYGFFRATSTADAATEATNLYNRTQATAASGKQPRFYCIDAEVESMNDMRAGVSAYMDQLNKLGVPDSRIVIYVGQYTQADWQLDVSRAGALWVPAYGTDDGTVQPTHRPPLGQDLWQYTSKGSFAGINGDVDMSTEASTRFKEAYLTKK